MNTKAPIFHRGEIAIQQRLGVAERMDSFGRMVIRDHMPAQHQQFYQSLPMLFVGFSDENDNVWASVLTSDSDFITSENDKSLNIKTRPFQGDPLEQALSENQASLKMGVLGIELETRRRNRMSGQVSNVTEYGFQLDVRQTFGNCPQYIQSRKLVPSDHFLEEHITIDHPFTELTEFDAKIAAFIHKADTFFVASSSSQPNIVTNDVTQGADVSHRGGRPGFVKIVNNKTLIIPDYMGNNHFNTLGNFMVNPSAGLLFIDFDTGDVITLTGKAQILWDDSAQNNFKGAERFWQFTLEKGYVLKSVMPWRFEFQNWSPNSQMTGTWSEAEAIQRQKVNQNSWQELTVVKIENESESIRSFYLEPEHGIIPEFKPGQFALIQVEIDGKPYTRNYSLSGSPLDDFLRISVKRDGLVSQWLHDNIEPSQKIQIKMPQGAFVLSDTSDKPAVLLSAGVGITPMVSMFRHIVKEGVRTRRRRPVIMFNTFRKYADIAFFEEITRLSEIASDTARAYWLLTQPEEYAEKGRHYSAEGRLNKEMLQEVLAIGKYDFYLCGPASFMQQTYDQLLELGVKDENIKAEAFGPAKLDRKARQLVNVNKHPAAPTADNAVVTFKVSEVEQAWTKSDGNLLDFAEAHGLTPDFSCRSGSCGSCKVKVKEGKVSHNGTNSFPVENDEALLCCATPAKTKKDSSPERLILEA